MVTLPRLFAAKALLEASIMIRFAFVIPFVVLASTASAQQQQGKQACARDASGRFSAYM
jgi:hypothetical protein